jgi:hypothetical protein
MRFSIAWWFHSRLQGELEVQVATKSETSSKRSAKASEQSDDIKALASVVLELQSQIRNLTQAQPPQETRLAKGTRRGRASDGDGVAAVKPRPADLQGRIREALRGRPMSAEQIAKATDTPVDTVKATLKQLEAINMVGSLKVTKTGVAEVLRAAKGADLRRWYWRPGPDAANEDRRPIIIGLLMEEALGNDELIKLTGAAPKQIENDLVEIRRNEPVWHMNKGIGGHGNIYFIDPDRRPPPPELDGRLARTARRR